MSLVSDVKDNIVDFVKERGSSPFWVPYVIAWAFLHWKAVYVTIFVGSDSLEGITKLDYVIKNLPRMEWWWTTLVALGITYFYYIFIRFIVNPTYWLKYWAIKHRFKIKEEADREIIEEKIKTEQAQDSLDNQWIQDYEEFTISAENRVKLDSLINLIYSDSAGNLQHSGNYNLNRSDVAFFDALKIVHIEEDKYGNKRASLTDKGKYFYSLSKKNK